MRTYKVTYFDADMDVESVMTYHNMNDSDIEELVINRMRFMNSRAVKVMKSVDCGEYYNVTSGFYHFAESRI